MTRAERVARGLMAEHGAVEAFWIANKRVRGWVVDGTDDARVLFWRWVRQVCYDNIGRSQLWV